MQERAAGHNQHYGWVSKASPRKDLCSFRTMTAFSKSVSQSTELNLIITNFENTPLEELKSFVYPAISYTPYQNSYPCYCISYRTGPPWSIFSPGCTIDLLDKWNQPSAIIANTSAMVFSIPACNNMYFQHAYFFGIYHLKCSTWFHSVALIMFFAYTLVSLTKRGEYHQLFIWGWCVLVIMELVLAVKQG